MSRLEAQGYRVSDAVVDGDDLILFAPPLWRERNPIEQRPAHPLERTILEVPEWRSVEVATA